MDNYKIIKLLNEMQEEFYKEWEFHCSHVARGNTDEESIKKMHRLSGQKDTMKKINDRISKELNK